MGITVFHCADVHFDSPFSLSSPSLADKRRSDLRSAFESAIIFAKSRNVQLFFISGDLFDSIHVTKDTAEFIISKFNSFPECRFFISPGNHDPINDTSVYKTLPFPQNVHIFDESRGRVYIEELGVCVYGIGFESEAYTSSTVTGYGRLDSNLINILVCHGDIGVPNSKYGPVMQSEIAASGFDYIAFGHIHKPSGLLKAGETYYSYPGCIEGRGFDELGHRGGMFGTISKEKVNLAPVQLSKLRYEITEIDVSGFVGRTAVIDKIRREIKEYINDTALRIILCGEVKEGFVIRPEDIGSGYEYPYYIEIIDRTVLQPDMTDLENDTTLKGIFYNRMKEHLAAVKPESDDYLAVLHALKYGICALDGRSFIDFKEDSYE